VRDQLTTIHWSNVISRKVGHKSGAVHLVLVYCIALDDIIITTEQLVGLLVLKIEL